MLGEEGMLGEGFVEEGSLRRRVRGIPCDLCSLYLTPFNILLNLLHPLYNLLIMRFNLFQDIALKN